MAVVVVSHHRPACARGPKCVRNSSQLRYCTRFDRDKTNQAFPKEALHVAMLHFGHLKVVFFGAGGSGCSGELGASAGADCFAR